jgi:hypothetical protein
MAEPETKPASKKAQPFTAALVATAGRLRAEVGLPAEKDLTAAAALVLALAVTRMQQAVEQKDSGDPAADAAARQREAVIAACVLQMGARTIAAAASAEGWPLSHETLAADAGRAVFAGTSREIASRIVANGAQTLAAMTTSRHPRAAELKKQIEACFTVYARTADPKAIAALTLLFDSLRAAARL